MDQRDITTLLMIAERWATVESMDDVSFIEFMEYVRISSGLIEFLSNEVTRVNKLFEELMELRNNDSTTE